MQIIGQRREFNPILAAITAEEELDAKRSIRRRAGDEALELAPG
jgi:hypothetical protein